MAKIRIPSEIKSEVAQKKVRGPDGKFLPADPEKAKVKEDAINQLKELNEQVKGEARIPDSDKEYIGSDSKRFFEKALERATTWYDGYKYAKELKAIQHPSLQAVQAQIKQEITTKVLKWEWEDPNPVGIIEVESNTKALGSSPEPLEDVTPRRTTIEEAN